MNKAFLIILILIVIGFGFYFFKEKQEAVNQPVFQEIQDVVFANNQFSFDFYLENKDQTGNIFFSPYSLSLALAMTYQGAKNETAQEIRDIFHFPEDNLLLGKSYSSLQEWFLRKNTDHEINIANSLWLQKDLALEKEYSLTISQDYQGLIERIDFVEKTEQSRERINNWVSLKTNEKIKDFIPQGTINSLTRLILVNAIYFKGNWLQEFNKINTEKHNFYINLNESIKVDMMQRLDKDAIFPYYATEDLQIIEMPYTGQEISMFVLLPKENDLEKLENQLTLTNLDSWQGKMEEQRVKVYLPKFKLETKNFLKPVFQQMGMIKSFTEQADFSGITGQKDLMINEIIHQAFIEVDEKGTEATAATGVVMELISLPEETIPVFMANRPFIFLIQEKQTKTILFFGRLANPEL